MINTIYIENGVKNHPRTQTILARFDQARQISIDRYGEVFNRRAQNFRLQKLKPALILAQKHSGHILPAPNGFGIGGSKNFYFAHMANCLYDCRYCFLQGMYRSANYIIFVNFEDFDEQIDHLITQHPNEKVYFFSGYDCDSLALESITGFAAHILPVFKKYTSAILEFRTKSVQVQPFDKTPPMDNCVIAFSLMPEVMSRALDDKAPSIEQRLKAMRTLANKGWKIGPRFDPLIYGLNWKTHYHDLFEKVFSAIPSTAIHSVSFGPLRFPQSMFRDIFKLYPEVKLFSGPLHEINGMVAYKTEIEKEMADFCRKTFSKFVSDTIVFQCTPEAQVTGRA